MKVKFTVYKTSENRLIVKMLTENGRELFDYVKKGLFRNQEDEIKNTKMRLTAQLGVKKVFIDNNLKIKSEIENTVLNVQNKTLIVQTDSLSTDIDLLTEELEHQKEYAKNINIQKEKKIEDLEREVSLINEKNKQFLVMIEIKNKIIEESEQEMDNIIDETIDYLKSWRSTQTEIEVKEEEE